jgi:hypothetical protein
MSGASPTESIDGFALSLSPDESIDPRIDTRSLRSQEGVAHGKAHASPASSTTKEDAAPIYVGLPSSGNHGEWVERLTIGQR